MIVITGASGGLGNHLLNQFKELNMDVIGTYLNTIPKETYLEKLDATKEDKVIDFVNENKDSLKNITFVHCTGVNINGITHKYNADNWDKTLETNLKSAFLMSKHLLPIMREQNYGRIIFCSSVVPLIGVPGTAAYSASKAALWGLCKTISKENAAKGITCNCLNIGYMRAGMTYVALPSSALEAIINEIPAKRLGNPDNVGEAVKFLINADYVTGTNINITGGLI